MLFVRTASAQDLSAVQAILVETWHDTYDEAYGVQKVDEITNEWHSMERLERNLKLPNSEFLVADNGEQIGAMAFATADEKTIKLHQLYVLPRFQGRKAGLQLLVEIENAFPGCDTICLEVGTENFKAIAFYESYGFVKTGETQNCGRAESAIPAIIMEKSIDYAG